GAFKFCQLDIYITDYHFLDTMLIFVLYGWSAIPLMYLLSFLFTRSTSAYIKLVLFNYLSGIFSLLIDATLQFEVQHKMSKTTRAFILNSLLFFPNYNLAKCISDYFTFYQIKKWCSGNKPPIYLNCSKENTAKNFYSLEEKMIGKYMIIMSITGFICLLFIFFLDTTLWKLRTFFNQYIYFGIYKTLKKVMHCFSLAVFEFIVIFGFHQSDYDVPRHDANLAKPEPYLPESSSLYYSDLEL
uniref:ATP-binding cassette sub-family A member 3-like n=1 Tax=Callorhinus ursinus TaxID=34884 RepID=A0A3Q7N7J6_CALUR